jgi:hypothetical protein
VASGQVSGAGLESTIRLSCGDRRIIRWLGCEAQTNQPWGSAAMRQRDAEVHKRDKPVLFLEPTPHASNLWGDRSPGRRDVRDGTPLAMTGTVPSRVSA